MLSFHLYHGLGNDYLVLPEGAPPALTAARVRRLCDRHRGIGADGVLLPVAAREGGRWGVRILNPDGSEAEKSGNGLRIFARFLWDIGRVGSAPFKVETVGGSVECEVRDRGRTVRVAMGPARFHSPDIPVAGPPREVLGEAVGLGAETVEINAVSVGNPHCVVCHPAPDRALAERLGPLLEHHPLFPHRTNVQFMAPAGPRSIRIEIWERGAGYTLASGSSSCAAAAVAVRRGLCPPGPLAVAMPGGTLQVTVSPSWELTLLGPVQKIAEGQIMAEMWEEEAGDSGE